MSPCRWLIGFCFPKHNLTLGYLAATSQQMVSEISPSLRLLALTKKIQYMQAGIRKSRRAGPGINRGAYRFTLHFYVFARGVLV